MPLYGTSALPVALSLGEQCVSIGKTTVVNGLPSTAAEASTVYPDGTAGERCALNPSQDGSIMNISAEVSFSVAPGAFEIDVQTADTDVDGAYQTVGGSAGAGVISAASQTGGAGLFWARAELQVKARFARLRQKTHCANACNQTGNIIR